MQSNGKASNCGRLNKDVWLSSRCFPNVRFRVGKYGPDAIAVYGPVSLKMINAIEILLEVFVDSVTPTAIGIHPLREYSYDDEEAADA